MSFHENDSEHIKTKKPIIPTLDLLSINYVGLNFVISARIR